MTDSKLPPPPVMWAQRSPMVFLTVNLEDVKNPDIKFTKNTVYFHGTGGVDKKEYEVTIPLNKEIDPEKSRSFNRGRCIEILLAKANPEEPYWPALTSDKKKHHWLKCDFNKWHDEDDSGDEGLGGMGGGGDFEEMMRQMGGLGGAGGGKPSFDDLDEGGDSDDEPIPDLE
ncbi:unnamed protein product [Ceutorhynchus assimilis]|uniref:CS domain-containing protein n=1 Tax=Ceutorhynchus assimilis TaxID=467358 RepID=A0A9P0GQX9_9CUCU|nr:unnamed protein product [Ceutorhynchus assimilis]